MTPCRVVMWVCKSSGRDRAWEQGCDESERQWEIRAINIHKQRLTCLRVVDVNMRTHLTLSLFNKLIINVTQRHDWIDFTNYRFSRPCICVTSAFNFINFQFNFVQRSLLRSNLKYYWASTPGRRIWLKLWRTWMPIDEIVSCSATVTVTDEFELQLTKIGDKARNWMTMFQNWSTKDEIETSIRTFQSVRDEIESTFSKIEWRDDKNGRENLYYQTNRGTTLLLGGRPMVWSV